MRGYLFTLISLACSLAVAATVYKWVDENGVVHYSDQPHPNAQKVNVPGAQTYRAPETPAAASAPLAPSPEAAPPSYAGCAIAQPADDETFQNLESLTVIVRTDPALHPGDQVSLTIDGAPVKGATGGQFVISPVERGTHVVQAVVRDSGGGLMCQTPPVTFHVHQPNLFTPRPAPAPH